MPFWSSFGQYLGTYWHFSQLIVAMVEPGLCVTICRVGQDLFSDIHLFCSSITDSWTGFSIFFLNKYLIFLEILTNSHFSFDWSLEITKNNLFIYYNFALSIFYWFKMFLTTIKFALLDRLSSVLFVCLFAFKLQIKFQKLYSKWDRSQIFILLYYSVCSVFHFSYLWNSGNFKCSASIANHQWLY